MDSNSGPMVIEVDDSSYDLNREWWIKDLELHAADHSVLKSGKELTENIINPAQRLLSQHFRDLNGFQPTYLSHYPNFEEISNMSK